MKLLSNKQYEKLKEAIKQQVLNSLVFTKKRCDTGVHEFKEIYSKKRNNHIPQYSSHRGAYAFEAGRCEREQERENMFDLIYVKSVCVYCGKELKE